MNKNKTKTSNKIKLDKPKRSNDVKDDVKNNFSEFAKLMSLMGEYYQPISPALQEIYWMSLNQFSIPEIKKAFLQHINSTKSGTFMPKIADFVKLIEGAEEAKALLAWMKITKAINEIGSYESVVFDDPAITETIERLGGWIKLCNTKEHEIPQVMKQFERLYEHYSKHLPSKVQNNQLNKINKAGQVIQTIQVNQAIQEEQKQINQTRLENQKNQESQINRTNQTNQNHLCGIFEKENRIRGYGYTKPVLIKRKESERGKEIETEMEKETQAKIKLQTENKEPEQCEE